MANGTKIGSLNLMQSTPVTHPTGRWCALFTRDEVGYKRLRQFRLFVVVIDNLAKPHESIPTAYF